MDLSKYKYPSYIRHRREYNKNVYYATSGKYEKRPWNDRDERVVMFSKKSDRELSGLLRRSVRAIQVRRNRILQEGRPWMKNREPVAKSSPVNTEMREQEKRRAAHDGYEKFYKDVFNPKHVPETDSYDNTALSADYMETVLYIIKESGFKDRWTYILMHHYGIGDCKEPETYEAIAGYLDMSIGRVAQIKARAMELCRIMPRKEILQVGITEYNKNHKGREKDDD